MPLRNRRSQVLASPELGPRFSSVRYVASMNVMNFTTFGSRLVTQLGFSMAFEMTGGLHCSGGMSCGSTLPGWLSVVIGTVLLLLVGFGSGVEDVTVATLMKLPTVSGALAVMVM